MSQWTIAHKLGAGFTLVLLLTLCAGGSCT
jgi:hypothetical protein